MYRLKSSLIIVAKAALKSNLCASSFHGKDEYIILLERN